MELVQFPANLRLLEIEILVGTNKQIVVSVHTDGRRVKRVDYNLRHRSRNQPPPLYGRGCVGKICHTAPFQWESLAIDLSTR